MESLLRRDEPIKYHHLDTTKFGRMVPWSAMLFRLHRRLTCCILGVNTKNLTIMKDLFRKNPAIKYWKFEVLYRFSTGISSSALHFIRNQGPTDGWCHMIPSNETDTTSFTISCLNWTDQDGIKDYSLYCIKIFA